MNDAPDKEGTPGDEVEDQRMPLLEHLEELRTRMIRALIAYAIALSGCVLFAKRLFKMLIQPAVPYLPEGSSFIYTKLPEAFITYLKVALLASVFVASPLIFYQAWQFIAPGLYKKERRMVLPFVFFSTLLFISGAVVCYLAVLPWACKFFLGYGDELTAPMLTISEYLSFSTRLLLAFGLVFELPLAMMFMGKIGIINPPLLKKARPFAVVGSFVAAAMITPPDVVTQVFLGLALMLLYELGGLLVRWVGPKQEESAPTSDPE